MAVKKKTTKSKKKLDVKVRMIGELIDATGSSKDTWNPAEISDDMKAISYIRKLSDTWNPAQLNEALKYLGFATIDSWNPAIIEETKNKLVKYFLPTNASGNPIELDLKGSLPYEVTSLTIDLLPIQDLSHGEPSPTNICPISGRVSVKLVRTGKNLIDTIEQGAISEGGVETSNNSRTRTEFIEVKGGTTYTSSVGSGLINSVAQYYTASKTNISRDTNSTGQVFSFTTPTNAGYVRLVFRRTNASDALTPEDTKNAMLELGSTPTPYEPPVTPKTYTETLGQTVYGGNVDLVNGVATVNKVYYEFDGTEDWDKTTTSGNPVVRVAKPSGINSNDTAYNACNMLVRTTNSQQIYVGKFYIGENNLVIGYDDTLENWKALIGTTNLQFVFELENPTTLTLTPEEISLLNGNNVISTDGDNINITYKAILNQ